MILVGLVEKGQLHGVFIFSCLNLLIKLTDIYKIMQMTVIDLQLSFRAPSVHL